MTHKNNKNMKKHLYIFLLCTLSLCTLVGCKKDEPETFISDQARPVWTAPEAGDMTSSMTAVVKVDLKAQYPEKASDWQLNDNDLLAAFNGETCLGVASPKEGLFFLYIAGTEGAVTLRDCSAHYKNFFEAKDAFTFANDAHLGTVAEPFVPVWE